MSSRFARTPLHLQDYLTQKHLQSLDQSLAGHSPKASPTDPGDG